MITTYEKKARESKAITDLRASIALHETALKDARAKADAAATALNNYRARKAAELARFMRAGQAGIFLPDDLEKVNLEEAARLTSAEAGRLDAKLAWLGDLLQKELEKQ